MTLPLGNRFGVQLDGAFGEIDADEVKGGGIRLFARDPEKYLLGLTAVYAELENVELGRYGVEAEGYFGQFTVVVAGGQQTGDVDDSGYASLNLRYYPLDNLMVEIGGSVADTDDGKAHIGAEYQIMGGLAVFADLATGENDYDHILGGVRYYFDDGKTLIKRHREADPANQVFLSVIEGLVGQCSNTYSERRIYLGEGVYETYRDAIDCNGRVVNSTLILRQSPPPDND